MSDAGLILELKLDGERLSDEELRRTGKQLASMDPALCNTLGEPAVWKPIPGIGLAVFEYWDETADTLVAAPDGKVLEAPWTVQVVDGEEVEMPDIPADNPPGDELLRRVMELDHELASRWLARQEPLGAVSLSLAIVEW